MSSTFTQVLALAVVCLAAQSARPQRTGRPRAAATPAGQSTYPVLYASPRRDCVIPAASGAKGVLSWSRELRLPNADIQSALLIWEGHVLATSAHAMALFSAQGGRLWERRKRSGSPVAAANGLLYYQNAGLYLDAVSIRNGLVLKDAYFPGSMSDEYHVTFLWPREKDFLATVEVPAPRHDSEGQANVPKPEIAAVRTVYGERTGEETWNFTGRQRLAPIFIPELQRLALALDQAVTIDVATGKEVSRFRIPLEKVANWSADAAGTLCILGYAGGNKALLALNLAGDEQWRWVDAKGSDAWAAAQPPVRAASGRVYAATEGRVLAFDNGKPVWASEALPNLRYASALADGTLLIAAGGTLRRLGADGRSLFSFAAGQEILAPPVVDGAGNIYVATATRLLQIR